jgi:small subunit ribosomal protein S2
MFIGTKRQAQEAIAEEAKRCGMPYVTERWLGGLLTNFVTVRRSLERLRELEMTLGGPQETQRERLTKKELAHLDKERGKLEKNLSGIKGMKSLPDAVFVIDTRKEAIAVAEARKLKIPVIGVVDTNCDPDEVDVLIPGNDDALRAIRLFAGKVADAILAGQSMRAARGVDTAAEKPAEPRPRARAASVSATSISTAPAAPTP